MACPYGAIRRHPKENKIVKCDLCHDREEGPACVQACLIKHLNLRSVKAVTYVLIGNGVAQLEP